MGVNRLYIVISVIIAFVIIAMMAANGFLHVLAGSSVVDHSTAADVTALTLGSSSLDTESSVQTRLGTLPFLIGADALEDAAVAANELKIVLNTWRNTDYIMVTPENLTERSGPHDPHKIIGMPLPLGLEADWTFTYQSTGAVDHFWTLLLAYPPFVPPRGGRLIHRKGAVTAADFSTTGAMGTAVNITDLNPQLSYRIHALLGNGGTDVGILELEAPSFRGMKLRALIPQGNFGGYYFDKDSQVINGVETLSVKASGGAASASEYHIILEEYGAFMPNFNGAGGMPALPRPQRPQLGGGMIPSLGKLPPTAAASVVGLLTGGPQTSIPNTPFGGGGNRPISPGGMNYI